MKKGLQHFLHLYLKGSFWKVESFLRCGITLVMTSLTGTAPERNENENHFFKSFIS